MKILVTGKMGQLGSELGVLAAQYPQYQWFFVEKEDMDLTDESSIHRVLNTVNPELIINTAAHTAVDRAESEPELADAINHQAVKSMALWAQAHSCKVLHISTDYVFDGNSSVPLTEESATAPINVYGKTKRLGELALIDSGASYIIIRTAWVYSSFGANFVKTMLRLMQERKEIQVVQDQVGAPTYARDLAQAILHIISSDRWIDGVYHYSNDGAISWYQFAQAIQEETALDCKVVPIDSSAFPTPAKRPHYSLLDKNKIIRTYGVQVPEWRESLRAVLNLLKPNL